MIINAGVFLEISKLLCTHAIEDDDLDKIAWNFILKYAPRPDYTRVGPMNKISRSHVPKCLFTSLDSESLRFHEVFQLVKYSFASNEHPRSGEKLRVLRITEHLSRTIPKAVMSPFLCYHQHQAHSTLTSHKYPANAPISNRRTSRTNLLKPLETATTRIRKRPGCMGLHRLIMHGVLRLIITLDNEDNIGNTRKFSVDTNLIHIISRRPTTLIVVVKS
ncbi:hypothetical protein YC2023_093221 [Brassica napus]